MERSEPENISPAGRFEPGPFDFWPSTVITVLLSPMLLECRHPEINDCALTVKRILLVCQFAKMCFAQTEQK